MMRTTGSLLAVCALLLAAPAGCKEDSPTCSNEMGQLELTVSFGGFDLDQAAVVEIETLVVYHSSASPTEPFTDWNRDAQRFPEGARDGGHTFLINPGRTLLSLVGTEDPFAFEVIVRVFNASHRLLGEGRLSWIGKSPASCYADRLTVSGAMTCVDKSAGEPCVGPDDLTGVCMESGGLLSCETSTCGDGFTDRRAGELCDPGMTGTNVECDDNCLPKPVVVSVGDRGILWTQLDVSGPSARAYAAAVYADVSAVTVLFGGEDAGGLVLDDTWTFDGVAWTQHTGASLPPARRDHAMAYDVARDVVVLFGGVDGNGTRLADTWEFHPTGGWTEIAPVTSPGERGDHALAYDPDSSRVILFGGNGGPGATLADTWTYDGLTWSEETVAGGPEGRFGHTLTHATTAGGLVMLGGRVNSFGASPPLSDTWLWDGTTWTSLVSADLLTGVRDHQVASLDGGEALLLFGGGERADDDDLNLSALQATWLLEGAPASWTEQGFIHAPSRRMGHVMVYDPVRQSTLLFGGLAAVWGPDEATVVEVMADTWRLRLPAVEVASAILTAGLKGSEESDTPVAGYYALGVDGGNGLALDRVASVMLADLDGDGADEILVGVPGGVNHQLGDGVVGKVMVHDHPLGDQRMGEPNSAHLTVYGVESGIEVPWFGASVAAGDINGDGAADMVVGAPMARDGAGEVVVILGGDAHQIPTQAPSSYTIEIERADDRSKYLAFVGGDPASGAFHLGYGVAVADFDGDGYADLVGSAPSEGDGSPEQGSVYVLAGPETSWPMGNVPDAIVHYADLTLTTGSPEVQLGVALGAGDVDGDGYPDLLVGAGPTERYSPAAASPRFGAVVVLFGGPDFFARGPTLIVEDLSAPDAAVITAASDSDPLRSMGGSVSAADLDGDGAAEFVVALGRPSSADGTPDGVAILSGAGLASYRSTGNPADLTSNVTILRGPAGSGFGTSLSVGDANGDFWPDLLIGAPFADTSSGADSYPRLDAGAVYVVLGTPRADYWNGSDLSVEDLIAWDTGAHGPIPIPLIVLEGAQEYGYLGVAATTGDHIAQLNPIPPRAYTLVSQPGWRNPHNPDERDHGRIWALYLAHLFPCGAQAVCPLP